MRKICSLAAKKKTDIVVLSLLLILIALLSAVLADPITSTQADGLLVYSEHGVHTSRYRLWNESNDFSAELTGTPDTGGDIQWVVVRGAPTRDEMLVGLENDQQEIHLQIFNSSDQWHNSTEQWNDDLELSTGVPNAAYRAFDIAYESLSGDALIVYENVNTNDNVIAYRIWNGSNYTAEQTFTISLTTNPYRWVALTPRIGTDGIMLLVHNGASDLYAVPWNGTAFDSSREQILSEGTTSNGKQHFAFAWEESSGAGLVGYGEVSNFVYRTYSPTAPFWSTEATTDLGNGLNALRMCSEPTSDYIGIIWQDAGNDVQARVWDGTQILSSPPSQEGTTEAIGASNVNVDCAWFNSSTALFGFTDLDALSIDYFTFTKANTWSTSDLEASTNNSGDFAADDIKGLRFVKHPKTSEVMVVEQDLSPGGDDIRAIRWNGTQFNTPTTYIIETDTEPTSGETEAAMFEWYRYDPVPTVSNINPSGINFTPGATIVINATVTDNIAVGTVLANVTLPNGTVRQLTMTDGDSDSVYNVTFTDTSTAITYTIRIITNDTDGHVNSAETVTFTVSDSIPPNVTALIPATGTIFNVSQVITIAANVTDDVAVSAVSANVTMPNGTANLLRLSLSSGTRYNNTFTIPPLIGRYNITFIANDTTPNINDTATTYFFANDTFPPNVSTIVPTNANEDTAINYNATVADNIALSSCSLYIGNINNGSMNISGGVANRTVTFPTPGTYVLVANCTDTSGNFNDTSTTTVTINDTTFPVWSNPFNETPATFNASSQLRFNITWSDNFNVSGLWFEVNRSGTLALHQASNVSATVWNLTLSGFPAGTHAWRSNASDSQGNVNTTGWYFFNISKIAPTINLTLNGSAGDVTIDEETAIWLNGTILAGDSSGNLTLWRGTTLIAWNQGSIANLSTFETPGTFNISLNYTSTQNYTVTMISYFVTANDVTPPAYSAALNVTPTTFDASATLNFSITWIDNVNLSASHTLFEVNRSGVVANHTPSNSTGPNTWNLSLTDFPAGTHGWRSWANDSSGNVNRSEWLFFTISEIAPTLNLTLNGTAGAVTIDEDSSIWLNGSLVTGDSAYTLGLAVDGASKGQGSSAAITNLTTFNTPGTFNVSLNYTATQNYSFKMVSYVLTVTDITYPTYTVPLNVTPATFNKAHMLNFSINWTDNFNLSNVWIDVNRSGTLALYTATNQTAGRTSASTLWNLTLTDFPAGTHYWRSNASDGAGNTNTTGWYTFTISKIAPTINLTLNGSSANITVEGGISIWLNGSIVTGDSGATLTLFLNGVQQNSGTSVSNLTQFSSLGDFNISLNYTTTQNYSAAMTSYFVTVIDTTLPGVTNLVPIAGTQHFNNINVTLSADLTDNVNVSMGWANVTWANGSMLLNLTIGTSPTYSVAFINTSEVGVYNVTFFANDTSANLNSTATTWFNVTVLPDTTPPSWADASAAPASPANYSETSTSRFNVTWTDRSSLGTVLIEHNFTGTLQNYTVTTHADAIYYYTYGPAVGTYVWRMYANDSSGNSNVTSQYTYNVTRATPTLTITNNTAGNTTYGSATNVTCAASSGQVTPVLYRNSTQITNGEAVILAVGTWLFVCNSSQAANYTDATATSLNLTITKASPTINLTLNGTAGAVTIDEDSSIWLNGSLVTGDAGATLSLYLDSVQQNSETTVSNLSTFATPGTYNVSLNYTATQNYSATIVSYLVTVTDLTAPVASAPLNVTPSSFNKAHTLNLSINWTDNFNLTLAWIEVNRSGTVATYIATNQTAGRTSASTLWNLTLTDFPAGTHYWRSNATDGAGNVNTIGWYVFNISQATPVLNLTLNGTSADIMIEVETAININGSASLGGDGGATLSLWQNGVLSISATTAIGNWTNFTLPGIYNLSLNYTATGNYSYGMISYLVTVSDTIPPAYSNAFNYTATTFDGSTKVYINLTWADNFNLSGVTISVNRSGAILNYTASNVSATVWNLTLPVFPAGTHAWKSNATDSTGNANATMGWSFFTIAQATPVLNLSLNGSEAALAMNEDTNVILNGSLTTGDIGAILVMAIDGTSYLTGTNLRNETIFATPGTYNISLSYIMTQNYSAGGNKSYILTVNDITPPAYSNVFNGTPAAFNTSGQLHFNLTWADWNMSSAWLQVNRSGAILNYTMGNVSATVWNLTIASDFPAGTHYWRSNATDSVGNLNTTGWYAFTISKAASVLNLTLNGTAGAVTIDEGSSIWLNGSIVTGDADVANLTLYLDSTFKAWNLTRIGNLTTFSAPGTYNVSLNYTTTENYTAGMTSYLVTVRDATPPGLVLNAPVARFNTTSQTVQFNFTTTDTYYTRLNCSLVLDSVTNYTNATAQNGTATVLSIASLAEGQHYWNVTCTDAAGNSNTSATRQFTVDSSAPRFLSLTTDPSTADDLDPNLNITVIGNATDNFTQVHTVTLQRRLSTASVYTNQTMVLNSTTGLYEAIFNATSAGLYYFRLIANDTVGNSGTSNLANVTVAYDYTWTRTPTDFDPVSADPYGSVTVGNLTINNTGDYTLNFTVTSSSNQTVFNGSANFSLAAKGVMTLAVNDTANTVPVKTFTLNITATPNGDPSSQTVGGTIVAAPGQPVLVATFTTPVGNTMTLTRGDTHIAFVAQLQNIGQGNASNVTFTLTLPADWSLTYGSMTRSFDEFYSGDEGTLTVEADIPSNATSGTRYVVVNCTGLNASGANLTSLGLTFADIVTVTVNELATLGALDEEEETPVQQASGGGYPPATLAGIFEKVLTGEELLYSAETFELVRGYDDSFPVVVKNIFDTTTLYNVTLRIEGYLSQYITVSPRVLDKMAYGQSKSFNISIISPDYMEKGTYDLTVIITGKMLGTGIRKDFIEKRKVTLVIHTVGEDEASGYIEETLADIGALEAEGITSARLTALLAEGERDLAAHDYDGVKSIAETVKGIKQTALVTLGLIQGVKDKMGLYKKTLGFLLQTSPGAFSETQALLNLATAAFERGDYETALQRMGDAQLALALERSDYATLFFFVDHWLTLLLVTVIVCLEGAWGYKRYVMLTITRRILNLDAEEDTLRGLIGVAQEAYFTKKSIGPDSFHRTMDQYHQRLSKVKQLRSQLRHKRVHFLSPQRLLHDLELEMADMTGRLKALQKQYFVTRTISKKEYDEQSKVYNERIAEIEDEQWSIEF